MIRCVQVGTLLLCSALLGCDLILDIVPSPLTTIRLVNNSDFDVEVVIFIDDEQDIPEELISETGTELRFTLSPGETTSFSRVCNNLQALIVEDADLRVIGGAGPDASTDVLRDGDDFGCGDLIILTFDHSDAIVDFDVSVSVEAR